MKKASLVVGCVVSSTRMRVLVAFDKFKHALSAPEACNVAAQALREDHPEWQVETCPLTDGGDGFCDVLTSAIGGRKVTVRATGPTGNPLQADFGLVAWERVPLAARRRLALPEPADARATLAVVELASASGLALVPSADRDPWRTTTFGTGELLLAAHRADCAAVLLGVGGSATNDLGLGVLTALGLDCVSADGTPLRPPVPAAWESVSRIRGAVMPELPPLRVACDVDNPLLGPRGCAAVYGPQKGLATGDIPRLDQAGARMALMLCHYCGRPDTLMDAPGAGAAGGTAFGLMAAAGAQLVNGSQSVADWLELDRRIAAADVVLTGEGSFDASSLQGKGPGAIAARARAQGKPVHVFAGRIAAEPGGAVRHHAITPPGWPLEHALPATSRLLRAAVQREFA